MSNSKIQIINDDHLQIAEDTLNDDEALVLVPYKDTKGNWTVGFGINLHTTPMPRKVANLWKTCIIEDIDASLSKNYSYYNKLSKVRQSVLINMAYQMGIGGLANFKKMHKALMMDDLVTAIDEMMDSKWYREHTNRANRLIFMFRFDKRCTLQESKSYYTNLN